MGLRTFIGILLICCGQSSLSQHDSISENEYIVKFPDKISTRISLINTSNDFYINDTNLDLKYKLEPNIRDYLGVSILFRSLEIDYGFSPNFFKPNKDNGDSKLFNLNFRMFQGQWMQTIDFYNQKGFYVILNNQKLDASSVKTFKIGGSTSYIFNKNFSFRAIGFQNEWQTKSVGSFIPRFYYYFTKYNINQEDYNEKAHTFDIAIAPSYYYNFVLKKHFLLSIGGSAGIGINHSTNLGNSNLTSALFEFSGRAVLGYNSKTFFGGINSNILILEHNVDRYTRQDDTIPFLEFYIGYRFNAPKKWVKFADDFNTKYGL